MYEDFLKYFNNISPDNINNKVRKELILKENKL